MLLISNPRVKPNITFGLMSNSSLCSSLRMGLAYMDADWGAQHHCKPCHGSAI